MRFRQYCMFGGYWRRVLHSWICVRSGWLHSEYSDSDHPDDNELDSDLRPVGFDSTYHGRGNCQSKHTDDGQHNYIDYYHTDINCDIDCDQYRRCAAAVSAYERHRDYYGSPFKHEHWRLLPDRLLCVSRNRRLGMLPHREGLYDNVVPASIVDYYHVEWHNTCGGCK